VLKVQQEVGAVVAAVCPQVCCHRGQRQGGTATATATFHAHVLLSTETRERTRCLMLMDTRRGSTRWGGGVLTRGCKHPRGDVAVGNLQGAWQKEQARLSGHPMKVRVASRDNSGGSMQLIGRRDSG
jgi:hypothetical protein